MYILHHHYGMYVLLRTLPTHHDILHTQHVLHTYHYIQDILYIPYIPCAPSTPMYHGILHDTVYSVYTTYIPHVLLTTGYTHDMLYMGIHGIFHTSGITCTYIHTYTVCMLSYTPHHRMPLPSVVMVLWYWWYV